MLKSSTRPGWFEAAASNLGHLLSDHLHCERKAAENALALVRRYPVHDDAALSLSRLAHEETSHVIQVAELMADRGYTPRGDSANLYARGLLAEVRPREPEHKCDLLLVAALIEARSHERLRLLEAGFAARGEERLSAFYRVLANAEDRHAELYRDLAERAVGAAAVAARLETLAAREAEIIGDLPFTNRVH